MQITLTTAAAQYIKNQLEKSKGIGFRLSVKKTGCSGYSYKPEIITESKAGDVALDPQFEINIFIDPLYQHLLEGLVIDCQEDKALGLKQKRLTFSNPNEHGRCGCGESFHLE